MDSKEITLWIQDPECAFNDFVRSLDFPKTGSARVPTDLPVKDSSAEIYNFMFSRFISWLQNYGSGAIHLLNTTPDVISLFLDQVVVESQSEIRWRYLRLLERVFHHLVDAGALEANPVSESVSQRIDSKGRKAVTGQDAPMAWLSPNAKNMIVKALEDYLKTGSWKERRDAALVVTIIGAGLKLSESLLLEVNDISNNKDSTIINVSKGIGTGLKRRVKIEENWKPFIQAWLNDDIVTVRKKNQILFPGTKNGDQPMDHATAYRRIKKILEVADLNPLHLGGRTLRNSYAVEMITKGTNTKKLAAMLGLQEDKSLNRYITEAGKIKQNK